MRNDTSSLFPGFEKWRTWLIKSVVEKGWGDLRRPPSFFVEAGERFLSLAMGGLDGGFLFEWEEVGGGVG